MEIEKQIVIYRAGKRGRSYYDFLIEKGLERKIYGFCDRKYDEIKEVNGKPVVGYEELRGEKFHYILSLVDNYEANKIRNILEKDGNSVGNIESIVNYLDMDRVKLNREICAFFHIHNMDDYFENAEEKESLDIFWEKDSEFFKLFKCLDISEVIELACGRGRHVSQYIDRAGNVTLVDILPENIEFCQERFTGNAKIFYYCNSGYNLEALESDKYTALFCYDAMVHFELLDIYEYLKDIYRVLKKDGYALIHHSNNGADYKASFANTYNGRSFMTKEVFAYLAYRVGFEVVEQKVIDWGMKDIDCISLIHKV